jgi:hypothetical protein
MRHNWALAAIHLGQNLMRKAIIAAFTPIALMTTVTLSTPALADANVKDVTSACDRTPGCNYKIDKQGTISGCSTGSGACFTCGQDGKCQGVQPRKTGAGKGRPVNIGGVDLPAAKGSTKTRGGTKVTTGGGTAGGTTKVGGKNISHDTAASNTDPQTKGPTNERRHGGGGARH